jgi:demethylmenaquinone methyltransferase / 2-methoxy-6-polyprenyl-1,4-benzoquinol methylase
LPFADAEFAGMTFTYLLRYVEDPAATMHELARVVRPGGSVGGLEFGVPRGLARPLWGLYVGVGLPLAGRLISPDWRRVGGFLGPSVREFAAAWHAKLARTKRDSSRRSTSGPRPHAVEL